MHRPTVWGMLVILLSATVQAEEPVTRADAAGQGDAAPVVAPPVPPVPSSRPAAKQSANKAAPDATRKAKPRKQDSNKKQDSQEKPAATKATPLRLQLPETAGLSAEVDPAAALSTEVSLPDLFSDKGADGRVVVDGRFLLEEDLETHPGSRTDSRLTEDAVRKQRGDGVEDYLQGVEGAELRLRIRME